MKTICYLFFIAFFLCYSSACESLLYDTDECDNFDESDCVQARPLEGDLTIKLTINEENPEVPYIIFENDIENKDTVLVDTAYNEQESVKVPLNEYYSIMAKYKSGDKIIYAVDGDRIESYSEDKCGYTCWYVRGGVLKVRLKY